MTDSTIIALQETVAHQEAEIERLSDELYAQQKEINALKNQMELMIERMKAAIESGAGATPQDEPPPPHY